MPIVKLENLDTLPSYESIRQKVINQINDKSIPFIYSEKHEFKFPKGTVSPVFVCETSTIDPKVKDVIKKSKKGNVAEGICYLTSDKKLVLRVKDGTLSESGFKVKGAGNFLIAKTDGPIGMDQNVGGNKIDINASKLDQFPDILKRQQSKLDQANKRLLELEQEKKKAQTTRQEVAKQKPDGTDKQAMEDWDKLSKQAMEAFLKISQEIQEQNKVKKFADDLLKKANSAKTPQEKANVVFEHDKFGSTIKDLEGTAYKAMMDTNDAIMVLGRTQDTWALQMEDKEKARALVVEPSKYNLVANDAFMKGGLDIKARFRMVSDFTQETVNFLKKGGITKEKFLEYVNNAKEKEPGLWNKNAGEPAVSAREMAQLFADGYWFGVYPESKTDPKGKITFTGKNIQMMFPRALKPTVLEEIRKLRKG